MLAQYLALQRAPTLRKSMKRNVKAVDSPKVNKKMTFMSPFVSGKLLHRFLKIHFSTRLQAQISS